MTCCTQAVSTDRF